MRARALPGSKIACLLGEGGRARLPRTIGRTRCPSVRYGIVAASGQISAARSVRTSSRIASAASASGSRMPASIFLRGARLRRRWLYWPSRRATSASRPRGRRLCPAAHSDRASISRSLAFCSVLSSFSCAAPSPLSARVASTRSTMRHSIEKNVGPTGAVAQSSGGRVVVVVVVDVVVRVVVVVVVEVLDVVGDGVVVVDEVVVVVEVVVVDDVAVVDVVVVDVVVVVVLLLVVVGTPLSAMVTVASSGAPTTYWALLLRVRTTVSGPSVSMSVVGGMTWSTKLAR